MSFPILPHHPLEWKDTEFQAHPTPHFILPEPLASYCITLYCTDDKQDLRHIFNAVEGRPPESTEPDAGIAIYDSYFEKNDSPFPFVAIRETASMSRWTPEDPSTKPPVVGLMSARRNRLRDTGWTPEERKRRQEINETAPDREAEWMVGAVVLDPKHQGRGIMTGVYNFVLSRLYLPLKPPPGRMAAGWEEDNIASQKLHERAGFEIVGKRPPEEGLDVVIVIGVWKGAGAFKKEDTIYRDVPDWP